MDKEQRDAPYGPGARFKEGETIVFIESSQMKQGEIVHVRVPGPAIVGGKEHGTLYIVDTGEGIPSAVEPSQVLEGAKPLQYI